MTRGLVATVAAMTMMIAVPLFARDIDSSFAEDRDSIFEEEGDFAFEEDRDSRFAEDTSAPGIDRRQRNQQRRIQYGKRLGAITPREAFRLERMLARIGHAERWFKADGHFTRAERARIHRMLDRSGRNIQLAMRNGRVAP